MKFTVTMKDPDCLHDAIAEAVEGEVLALPISNEEREAVHELRVEAAQKACRKWFRYGEYLTVEVDTDAGTCVVVSP